MAAVVDHELAPAWLLVFESCLIVGSFVSSVSL
jgi:hypothetical protein